MGELRVLVPQSLKRGNPVLVVSVSIPTCASKMGSWQASSKIHDSKTRGHR